MTPTERRAEFYRMAYGITLSMMKDGRSVEDCRALVRQSMPSQSRSGGVGPLDEEFKAYESAIWSGTEDALARRPENPDPEAF